MGPDENAEIPGLQEWAGSLNGYFPLEEFEAIVGQQPTHVIGDVLEVRYGDRLLGYVEVVGIEIDDEGRETYGLEARPAP